MGFDIGDRDEYVYVVSRAFKLPGLTVWRSSVGTAFNMDFAPKRFYGFDVDRTEAKCVDWAVRRFRRTPGRVRRFQV